MRHITEPQPYRDGSRVIHIGLPKTGTSSLQAAFDAGRDSLAEQGVVYPMIGRHQLTAIRAGLGVLEPWRDQGRRMAEWEALAERVRTSDTRLTLLSSEAFSGALPGTVPSIVEQLGDNLEIVVTLRPLAPLLGSLWQQELYRRETASLEDWLRHRLSAKGGPYQLVMHRQALQRIVQDWAPSVGEQSITFLISDPDNRSATRSTFETLLGVRPGTLPEPPWANASLPYPEAELLRHFGIAYSARGGADATWLRTIRSTARFSFAELSLPRQPIQLPRWAAERANELTAGWVDAIHDTGVTVVGDLDHLYVDPADYLTDPEVPTTVGVDSAGAMMDAVFAAARASKGRRTSAPGPTDSSLQSATTKELLGELRHRLGRRR